MSINPWFKYCIGLCSELAFPNKPPFSVERRDGTHQKNKEEDHRKDPMF